MSGGFENDKILFENDKKTFENDKKTFENDKKNHLLTFIKLYFTIFAPQNIVIYNL